MKKESRFNIGDKVFAKVKGYPPWPATVLEETGKKYKVKFYGTNEMGQIKGEDLFYYTKNKHKFLKPIKRKDFQDSVKEIEAAIEAAGGSDGSPPETVIERNTEKSPTTESDNDSLKNKKRKRSSSNATDATPTRDENSKPKKGKIENDESPMDDEKEEKSEKSETTEGDMENEKVNASIEIQQCEPEEKEAEIKVKNETNVTTEEETENINVVEKFIEDDLIFEKDLKATLDYAAHVESNKEIYTKMDVEPRPNDKSQIFPFVSGEKCLGIKYHETWPLKKFLNEYERALFDRERAESILETKNSFDSSQLDESPQKFETLTFTQNDLDKIAQERLMKMKEDVLDMLKTESVLTEIDAQIRSCLNLNKAEPKEAVKLLQKMLTLNLNTIMLKKYSHVVDVARRLRKYIGNLDKWDMTDDEKQSFRKEAEEVRKFAMKVFVKFMNIVGKPVGSETFWDAFSLLVTKFKESTKDLSEFEFYTLTSEPNSRKSFFYNYFMKEIGTEAFAKYAQKNSATTTD